MPSFFRIRADNRVTDLTHSSRLTESDKKVLLETYSKDQVKAFALQSVHPSLLRLSNNGGRVTSRTLWTLKIKSKSTDGVLLRYTLGGAIVFLDETKHMFYASRKEAVKFVQSLNQRAEKLLLPPKRKAAELLLHVASALLNTES